MYYDKRTEVMPEAPIKELEQWQKDLLAAAQYIREHGWCQGLEQDSEGRVCLAGALRRTLRSEPMRVSMAWGRIAAHLGGCPMGWNDTMGRKVEEVLSMLEGMCR